MTERELGLWYMEAAIRWAWYSDQAKLDVVKTRHLKTATEFKERHLRIMRRGRRGFLDDGKQK